MLRILSLSKDCQYGEIADCWKIDSEAKYDFGTSTFTYWFHVILGFVKMEYENYGNQRMSIELEEVIDGGS